jgi:hypothetical protein
MAGIRDRPEIDGDRPDWMIAAVRHLFPLS